MITHYTLTADSEGDRILRSVNIWRGQENGFRFFLLTGYIRSLAHASGKWSTSTIIIIIIIIIIIQCQLVRRRNMA